jgi:crotonobetaine/carnitine-CoA ligase
METVFDAFAATAAAHPKNAFIAVPARAGRDYLPDGAEFSYGEAFAAVAALRELYRDAGYGPGNRVALLLENRPLHLFHLLALNALGCGAVPVNPYYTADEMAYQMAHSEADLAVAVGARKAELAAVAARRAKPLPVVDGEALPLALPRPLERPPPRAPGRADEAVLMYTSGTTGRPKGCVLSNEFALAVGEWYARIGGRLTLRPGLERVFVPLPFFHVNAGINTPTALILSANCLVIPDRFHPDTWWRDLVATRATAMHYLGIVPPILLKRPPCPEERQHAVRFGLGAGIDPELHAAFEARFGIPMVEVWGMTETGRFLADHIEPRRIGTRAFGGPRGELEAIVVDDADQEMPRETPGELIVRCAGADPRRGFFSGYLKDAAATEAAWRGGWFHTGDIARQAADGMLYFVDRRKNIVRRSGENIAAAEVEAALIGHEAVAKVAVIAVPDELREEEVMACVALREGVPASGETARLLFEWAQVRLAYYKAPGWIAFVADLPTTSTQKIRKGLIFPAASDPRRDPQSHDLRPLKKARSA